MLTANEKISVALYARVSTEEQKENFSLAGQLEILRKHAVEKNYQVFEEYVDGGFSGTTMERPAFKKMLADSKKRKFQLVLVYKLDRFFRNNRALLTVSDDLEKNGIGIKSVTEPFDTSNHLGKFILSLFGSLAQLERDTFMERSKMGRMRRAREGYYSGSNPTKYGYTYNVETRKLDICEKEAEAVVSAFKIYNEHESSLIKVAKRLNALGYKTKKGNDFTSDVIHDILTSTIYMGLWHANKHTYKGKFRPKEEWIEVKMPALITEQVFDKTQKLLLSRKNYTVRNVKYQYLLQGLVKCGDCGNTVAGTADKQCQVKNGKKYGPYFKLYYRCTHFVKNLYKRTVQCRLRYIQSELLESIVWNEIERLLNNPSIIAKAIEYQSRGTVKQTEQLGKEIMRIKARLDSFVAEEQRVIEAYRHNILSMEQLEKEISKIKVEKDALAKKDRDVQELLALEKIQPDEDQILGYVQAVKDGVKQFTYETKKIVLEAFKTRLVANINGVIDIFLSFPRNLAEVSSQSNGPNMFSWQPLQRDIYFQLVVFTRQW